MNDLRGLTFHRPWLGGAILADFPNAKRIENRKTRPPKCIRGQFIALHSGKVWDGNAAAEIARKRGYDRWDPGTEDRFPSTWSYEGIVGIARVKGWHEVWHEDGGEIRMKSMVAIEEGQRQWVRGPYCWILEDVVPLVHPVPHRGMQGVWRVSNEALIEIEQQTGLRLA